jgi:hypothetical protein
MTSSTNASLYAGEIDFNLTNLSVNSNTVHTSFGRIRASLVRGIVIDIDKILSMTILTISFPSM